MDRPVLRPGRGLGSDGAVLALLMLVSLLLGSAQACGPFADEGTSGKALWKRHCAKCHGLDAGGKVPKYRRYEYSNLVDDVWMESGSNESLTQSILGGLEPLMPAFDSLTDQEVAVLLEYLEELRGGR